MLDKLACLVGNGGERKGYACFLVSYAELLWLLARLSKMQQLIFVVVK